MSQIPTDLKYTKTHEWVKQDGDVVTFGVTDYAQQLLGDLVFVELPDIDADLVKEDECCVLESVKAAADVYAPVAGVVVEINEALADKPELINQSPYDEGWIAKIEITDPEALKDLLSDEDYEKHIASEQH